MIRRYIPSPHANDPNERLDSDAKYNFDENNRPDPVHVAMNFYNLIDDIEGEGPSPEEIRLMDAEIINGPLPDNHELVLDHLDDLYDNQLRRAA